jgi:hypothetical protein
MIRFRWGKKRMKNKYVLFFGLAFWCLLFTACQPQIPTNISVSDNPPNTSNQPAPVSSGPYIIIQPREVSLSITPQGGKGNFRLLIVVADDQGHSGGMFCPGTTTTPIDNGDTLTPCQTAISFPTSLPQDRIYVLIVGINEKDQSDLVDIGAGALSGLLAKGVLEAVGLGAASTGPAGFVAGLAIETIIGYAGGKAADWAQQNEILGSQTYVLERGQNWYDGRKLDSDSVETSMHFSFSIEVSNTAKGEMINNENPVSNQVTLSTSTLVNIPSTEEPVAQLLDPKEALYAYYDSLNIGDYKGAWNMLSDHFKQKNNSSGYGPYEDWFRTIRETQINRVNVESQTDDVVTYLLELSYYYQDGKVDTCDIVRIVLVYDEVQSTWVLDDWNLVDGSCNKS